jgi:hypothetical protein
MYGHLLDTALGKPSLALQRSSFLTEVFALIIIIDILGVVRIRYYMNHKVGTKKQTKT